MFARGELVAFMHKGYQHTGRYVEESPTGGHYVENFHGTVMFTHDVTGYYL